MSQLWTALVAEPVGTVRTGAWAARAAVRASRCMRREAQAGVHLPIAPSVPPCSEAAMLAVLRASRQPCYVVAAVRQAWHRGQGEDRDVVIGVRRGDGALEAHAWLDGDAQGSFAGYCEISRRAYAQPLGGAGWNAVRRRVRG